MSELAIGGLTLREYAGVYAATSEGFPLDVVLEAEGITPGTWAAADEAWGDALAADLQAGGSLSDEFDLAMFEAQEGYRRPVPPLDDSLPDWLLFVRAWSEAEDPVAFLRERGLGPNDLARLHRLWAERLAADKELQQQALALLQAEGEAPVPHPEPLELRSILERRPHEEGPPSVREPPRAPSLKEPVPSLSGPQPAVRARPERAPAAPKDDAKTWVDGIVPLPVAIGSGEHTQVPPSSAVNAFDLVPLPEGFAPPPVETVVPADPSLTEELTLAQHAALCAELAVSPPEDSVAIFLKYGLGNDQRRARIDAAWRERLETRTLLYAEWRQLYRHFHEHFLSLRRR